MKRFCLLSVAFLLLLTSCKKQLPVPQEPQEVEVSFTYAIPQSGSMTKSSAAEIYDAFYNSYVLTGEVLPLYYSLTVTTQSGDNVASFAGEWSKNKLVKLPTGRYHVSGTSKGGVTLNDNYHRAPLSFDEDIEITASTTTITLHAKYNCFLLLFDAEGKTYFSWSANGSMGSGTSGDVKKLGDVYYLFVQEFSAGGSVSWQYGGRENKIWMAGFNFQKGYYYYFNDVTGSFEIPKMEQGDI